MVLDAMPIAVPDAISTDEASQISVDVLANDAGAAPLILTAVDNSAVAGHVSFLPSGTLHYDPAGQFEHLAAGQHATETIPYTFTDSDGVVASSELVVSIHGINDAPVAANDQYSTLAGQVLTVSQPGLLANDIDVDNIGIANAGVFFASPSGTAGGDGSLESPWDLATLFAHPAELQPGNTVYLRGGRYHGHTDTFITGTAEEPIVVRAYPGERVTIDLHDPADVDPDRRITFYGDYVHWMDIEFMSSDPTSRITDIPGIGYPDINRGSLTVRGSQNKFINIVSHDLNIGMGLWDDGEGGEIYGAIFYNNGWLGPDRPHGHAIYTQNEFGVKRIADSLIFNQFGMGIHAFGSSNANMKGFNIEGNVMFNNGAGAGAGFDPERELLVGAGSGAENIRVANNFTYQNGRDGLIGFGNLGQFSQRDIEIVDNYFVGHVGFHSGWEEVTYRGNSHYVEGNLQVDVHRTAAGVEVSDYDWDHNTYRSDFPTQFRLKGTTHTLQQWQTITGLDGASTHTASQPPGAEIFVRPNEYEPGRGHVVVYNWDVQPTVDVDLSNVLQSGDEYEIRNVVDLYGEPVLTGIYDGSPVALPMTAVQAPSPIGYDAAAPVGTGPEFGTFLVTTPIRSATTAALEIDSFDSASALGAGVTVDLQGGFVYDPTGLTEVDNLAPNDQLQDTFSYTVTDGQGGFDSAVVTITISGTNRPPQANHDQVETSEDSGLAIDVAGNDVDPDTGDSLQLQSVGTTGTVGTVTVGAGNIVHYDPAGRFDQLAADDVQVDTFTYTIADTFGASDTATVTVTVGGRNDAPTAANDFVATTENMSLIVDVIAGDSDADATDSLSVVSVDNAATTGTASLNASGQVVYDPADQFEALGVGASAQDSFRYTIADVSGATATATVFVTVSGLNDAPVADDDTADTDERTAITVDVLSDDFDIDAGDVLSVIDVDDSATNGTVTIQADGSLRYDPAGQFNFLNAGESTTDTFLYEVSDQNGSTATASATITVRGISAAPVPTQGLVAHWPLDQDEGTLAVDQSGNGHDAALFGDPVWTSGILNGGLKLDGSGDYINAGLGPAIVGTSGFSVAAWVLTSSISDQVIVQQRSPTEYNGQYVFELQRDGRPKFWTFGGSRFGPRVSSIQPINDGAWHHVVGVREDDGTTKIYIDGQVDGSASGSPRPLVPINVYVGVDGRGARRHFSGSLDDVRIYDRALDLEEVDALFQYVPGSETRLLMDDAFEIDEDSDLSLPAPGILANDSGEGLRVTQYDATSVRGGSVSVSSDGAVQYSPAAPLDSLGEGETLGDSFSYTATDSEGSSESATVAITILGSNDAPVASGDTSSTTQHTAIDIEVLINDVDPDLTDSLGVTQVDSSATQGTVSINPDGTIHYDPAGQFAHLAGGESELDVFHYTVTDRFGATASAQVTVTVLGVDEPPIPVEGLLAYWSFDQDGGESAIDLSGNGNDAQLIGPPARTAGKLDGGLTFNGNGDHLSAGQGPAIVGTQGFSVSAWVGTTAGGEQVIVQQRSRTQYNGQYVLQLIDGKVRFWTFGGSAYGPRVTTTQTINDGQWHHVTGVREEDGKTKIYVDGILQASKAGAPRPLVPINVYVGADMRGGTRYLNGSLDEVRIYNRALDADEVARLNSYQGAAIAASRIGKFVGTPNLAGANDTSPSITVEEPSSLDSAKVVLLSSVTSPTEGFLPSPWTDETAYATQSSVDEAFDDSGFVDELGDPMRLLSQS